MSKFMDYMTIGAFLLLLLLAGFWFLSRQKRKKIKLKKTNSGKWVLKVHRLLSSMPLLKKYYYRVYQNVKQIYPANTFSVIKKTVNTTIIGFSIFAACVVFVLVVAQGDILFILTGLLVSFVLMSSIISEKLIKQETLLLTQFQGFLETMRYYYNDCGKVDEALDKCIAEMPYELSLHMQKIHDVITDVELEKATEEYVSEPNNRFFLMFCSICSTITKQGDRPLPNGVTIFLNNIKHLQEELNTELLKKAMIKTAFTAVNAFSILPILFLKPIQMWATSNQEEMAIYYSGAYGTCVMFLIFFMTTIGNMVIDNLKNGTFVENVKLWTRLSKLPIVNKIIDNEIRVHFSKAQKVQNALKRVGSLLTVQAFYAKKIFCAIGCMILFNCVVLASNTNEKSNILNDFDQVFTSSYATDAEYTETLKEVAKKQVQVNLREKELSDEDLNRKIAEDILSEGTITSISSAQEVASVVTQKVSEYHSVYYRWWLMLITFIMGCIGFYAPEFILKSKKKAMEMEMEDEIIQFQAIALILMHIKESTVADILTWMERFSKCFKSSITKCLMNLDSGPIEALEKLKEDEPAPQFQKIINSLINVDKVGVEAAFDSIETERNFLAEKRNQSIKVITNQKARKAWMITLAILFGVIGLWIVVPMALMGWSMTSQLLTLFGA